MKRDHEELYLSLCTPTLESISPEHSVRQSLVLLALMNFSAVGSKLLLIQMRYHVHKGALFGCIWSGTRTRLAPAL